ncbi:MAG: DNA polymerase III subunit delta [Planctomycetaceae bacterium]|nr:DNA polymerase III subunit delta [Planctomycetaceae bacterium]
MHAIEFLRDPAKVPVKPVYAVFGDDPFLRRESLETIGRVGLQGEADAPAVARFAGEHAGLADVLDEVRTLPFFSSRRVAIVESADPFVTAHRKELEAYVEHPSASGVLVLSVKTWPANTRLAKLVDKMGLAIDCKGPNERELVPWLTQLALSRTGAPLDDDAARLLLELVGPETGLLVAEIEKLAVFVGTRARIRRDDVAKMVGAGRIETIWKVLDAATTGRGDVALEHLDHLIAAGEYPVGLLAAMSASLLKVHHAGRLRRARMKLEDACREAGIPFVAVEKTQRQHAHLGPKRVDQLPELLLQADLDLKGSTKLEPRAVLERLLVRLSGPRQD